MSFVQNAVQDSYIETKRRWKAFLRDLPFRMQLGKLGIWLQKVGRVLQVRYANWNSEFRLVVEMGPIGLAGEQCTFHVSEILLTTQEGVTFNYREAQIRKQTPMIKELLNLKGVKSVYLHPYFVFVMKAKVYDWAELLPEIERIILEHCTKK
jgi:hypothetical protein